MTSTAANETMTSTIPRLDWMRLLYTLKVMRTVSTAVLMMAGGNRLARRRRHRVYTSANSRMTPAIPALSSCSSDAAEL